MNFIGTAARLAPGDFSAALALMPGVEAAALRAVIAVETGGSGFDRRGRPSVLFERHLFWAALGPGAKRDRAAAEGLAYARWGERPYPRSSDGVYDEIGRAAAIDEDAALRSTSWGLGQILGREHDEAGYPNARAMVEAFMAGEGAQLAGMVRLIKARRLDGALRDHRWADFARAYNGAGFRKNRYDEKLAAAYRRFLAGGADAGPPLPEPDPAVAQAQAMLHRLRLYDGAIDGVAGPVTQAAILAFQLSRPFLIADGVLGPKTRAALGAAASLSGAASPVTPRPPAGRVAPGGAGAGSVIAGLGAASLSGSFWVGIAVAAAIAAALFVLPRLRRKAPSV
ncbi:MAG: N-acetylmuramidase domain-containing protein [Bauldia sp.]